jgi:hypothetical protein
MRFRYFKEDGAVDLQPPFRHAGWMKRNGLILILISLIDQTQKAQVHLPNKEKKGEKQEKQWVGSSS